MFRLITFLFQVWIFGDIWCSVWLAVDVWMCTASILNLCAISLDRYLAVTRPVSYPQVSGTNNALYLTPLFALAPTTQSSVDVRQPGYLIMPPAYAVS